MPDALDFEQPLIEIENRIAGLQAQEATQKTREEIAKLEDRLVRLRQKTYASLTAWQRTQLARHPKRPHTRDLFKLLFDDFIELHGDRVYGDDAAIVGAWPGSRGGRSSWWVIRRGGTRARRSPATSDAASRGLSQGAPAPASGPEVR